MALVFRKVVVMKVKRRKKGQKKNRVRTKAGRVMRERTVKGVYCRRAIKNLERT